MKLYEIAQSMREALTELERAEEAEDAEAYEACMVRLESLNLTRNEKLAGCCAYHRELSLDIDCISREIERLKLLKSNAEKRLESWEGYIQRYLEPNEKWANEMFSLSWRKSTAVRVEDEKLIPELYWREKVTREIDKKALTTDLKCGATVPGVTLEERQNLQVR